MLILENMEKGQQLLNFIINKKKMRIIVALVAGILVAACGTKEAKEVKVNRKEVKIVNGDTTITSSTEFRTLSADEKQQELKEVKVLVVGPSEFDSLAKLDNAQLIDVRTAAEFNAGHINNATNYDILNGDFGKVVNTLVKSEPTLVYCKSGGRSSRARKQLVELGFELIVELEGGYSNYTK